MCSPGTQEWDQRRGMWGGRCRDVRFRRFDRDDRMVYFLTLGDEWCWMLAHLECREAL